MPVLLVAVSAATAFAGAWTEPRGAFYEKLSYNYYYAHETFDGGGNRAGTAGNGKFTDNNISNYAEYGLTDDLTVINALTYKWLENENDDSRATAAGIGDVDLGARYKLHESHAGIVSAQVLVKIPGTYGKSDPLPLGNGQVDAELRFLYGRSLYPFIPGYANVELGYRWRTDGPADELRYLAEFGLDFTKSVYGRVKLDGIYSMDNGRKLDGSGNPTATNNFDLGKLDVAVGYKIGPAWGLELSCRPDIYGQNTAAGTNYSLAVYYKTP
ncbi:transporter [Geobacter sp. FeAm09]|nr:transporter [Geobacter sp. FeAm09]